MLLMVYRYMYRIRASIDSLFQRLGLGGARTLLQVLRNLRDVIKLFTLQLYRLGESDCLNVLPLLSLTQRHSRRIRGTDDAEKEAGSHASEVCIAECPAPCCRFPLQGREYN